MERITTVVLCGGRGTRAHPHTVEVPKPLMQVGEQPILRHVLDIYAEQGFVDFVLSAGYLSEQIVAFAADLPDEWNVEVVDTGEETNTAGRVAGVREHLSPTFFVTYGDGVGDIDLASLLRRHRAHGGLATLTCVSLPSPYGVLEFDDAGAVRRFREKPRLPDHLINAGFFAFDREVFEHWHGEDLEREVLPALGGEGLLYAYRHDGFWRSMDTHKDALELTALCDEGRRPWMTFAARGSS